MKCCGEFCCNDNLRDLNKIQYHFHKRSCRLKVSTPRYCPAGELGVQTAEFHFHKAALTSWTKLIKAGERGLISELYQHSCEDTEGEQLSKTWRWQMKKLLQELNLEELWTNQSKKDEMKHESTISTRLREFQRTMDKQRKHSHKGLNCLELTLLNCEMKPHLNFTVKDASVLDMPKLRTGNYNLSIETERYRNRKAHGECL